MQHRKALETWKCRAPIGGLRGPGGAKAKKARRGRRRNTDTDSKYLPEMMSRKWGDNDEWSKGDSSSPPNRKPAVESIDEDWSGRKPKEDRKRTGKR